jgi:NADH-quinone oxidoreductase subunit L
MLWYIPALPLGAFFILLFFGYLGRSFKNIVGTSFIFLSFITSLIISMSHWGEKSYAEILWTWIPKTHIGFVLDPLSIIMILVITFVASLVALYSTKFMSDDPSLARFFAYLNLFVASMLILVLADNLLLLFAGWEGVGLCSYLLIGFWYERPETNAAAHKAFITTRVADVFLLIGIIYLGLELNTLTISTALIRMGEFYSSGSLSAHIIALCLLIGALGKSAQFPFHTWLPDAMLGPTPASALIHAATMVTAGVYLLARMAPLFNLAPDIQHLIVVGAAFTLILGSWCALRQSDLKRVLAYSTISQIGYMFLALGAGAPGAAMFHFTTHAFFKALLFLGAGVIGEALHHEYNMFKMGGLKKELPLTYYTFLMGSAALVGLPLISSGYYSKELILSETYLSPAAGLVPWIIGVLGALLTALYVGRMIILVFFGKAHAPITMKPTWPMTFPLIILAFLSLFAGALQTPLLQSLGFGHHKIDLAVILIASAAPVVGLIFAYLLYKNHNKPKKYRDFRLDNIYKYIFIYPYIKLSHYLRKDFFIHIYTPVINFINFTYALLSQTQNGRIGHYLTVVVASALTIIGFLVWL